MAQEVLAAARFELELLPKMMERIIWLLEQLTVLLEED